MFSIVARFFSRLVERKPSVSHEGRSTYGRVVWTLVKTLQIVEIFETTKAYEVHDLIIFTRLSCDFQKVRPLSTPRSWHKPPPQKKHIALNVGTSLSLSTNDFQIPSLKQYHHSCLGPRTKGWWPESGASINSTVALQRLAQRIIHCTPLPLDYLKSRPLSLGPVLKSAHS
jgi:hypothetical protein